MSQEQVVCLCPTFRRPLCARQAYRWFLRQTDPGPALFYLLDDDGGFKPQVGYNFVVESVPARFWSLPAKYNWMVRRACEEFGADIVLVWEDDDVYLPGHIAAYREALAQRAWCHPAKVLSDYKGTVLPEPAEGRFHAALGMRARELLAIGGWPETPSLTFDQQLITKLYKHFGQPARPAASTYVFHWRTGYWHGESLGGDGLWYQRAAKLPKPPADFYQFP